LIVTFNNDKLNNV